MSGMPFYTPACGHWWACLGLLHQDHIYEQGSK
jgi:hypothetical protein